MYNTGQKRESGSLPCSHFHVFMAGIVLVLLDRDNTHFNLLSIKCGECHIHIYQSNPLENKI